MAKEFAGWPNTFKTSGKQKQVFENNGAPEKWLLLI
jgi:hypothetical protein